MTFFKTENVFYYTIYKILLSRYSIRQLDIYIYIMFRTVRQDHFIKAHCNPIFTDTHNTAVLVQKQQLSKTVGYCS